MIKWTTPLPCKVGRKSTNGTEIYGTVDGERLFIIQAVGVHFAKLLDAKSNKPLSFVTDCDGSTSRTDDMKTVAEALLKKENFE